VATRASVDFLKAVDFEHGDFSLFKIGNGSSSHVLREPVQHRLRAALELHPGFVVYNPATLLKLRSAVGETVGANLDPSHLYWQGIDPLVAIRELKDAIHHFHAKDTLLHPQNIGRNGVLDLTPYENILDRSWTFRSVGRGHGELHWSQLMAELRLAGYDGAVSIEHEDALMSVNEGLRQAVSTLKRVVLREQPAEAWWLK